MIDLLSLHENNADFFGEEIIVGPTIEEETCTIDFTAHGRITFRGKTPEDWAGEAKSIIENLGCDDPQVKDLDIHRVDIYS